MLTCRLSSKTGSAKEESKLKGTEEINDEVKPDEKLSLFQRFRQMYKEYWYVLIPVHIATSVVWYGSFYYALKS